MGVTKESREGDISRARAKPHLAFTEWVVEVYCFDRFHKTVCTVAQAAQAVSCILLHTLLGQNSFLG